MKRFWLQCGQTLGLATALTTASCIGNLSGNALSTHDGTLPNSDQGGLGNSGGGSGGGTGTAPQVLAAGKLPLRRLLKRELLNSYRDLLGPQAVAAVDASKILDDGTKTSYDNDISLQSVSAMRMEGYMDVGRAAATAALADDRIQATLGCATATPDTACMQAFIPRFGRLAFRRPLETEEVNQYLALFASESSGKEGAILVVQTMLSTPSFLYQPEVGTTKGAKAGYVRLTPYEVASKLSFLLLGTTPSAELLDAAENGELATTEGIGQWANTMLERPEGKAYLRNFANNWLGLTYSGTVSITTLPNDNAQVRADMTEETLRLFDDFAQPGAHFVGIYTAPYTYVTTSLAPIYGVTAAGGSGWSRADFTTQPRAGLLTQASVLNLTGVASYPAIFRGKWVLERLLCRNAGSPPADAQASGIPEDLRGKTEREQLAAHLGQASCAACHDSFDPIGFGFERYDAVGNYRTADAQNRPLSGAGAVTIGSKFDFSSPAELGQQLAQRADAQRCVAENLAHYLLGRAVTQSDDGLIDLLDKDLQANDLPTAILDFVTSEAFLTRQVS